MIADALKTNNVLQKLGIDSSTFFFGDTGVRYIAETLKVNTGLQSLSLRDQAIGYVGALYLAESLELNSTLQKLDLACK
jgi:hypothetical protein